MQIQGGTAHWRQPHRAGDINPMSTLGGTVTVVF
ncbi:hypothetical protein BH23VER1_BH23VER1_29210 [soil metagenome]